MSIVVLEEPEAMNLLGLILGSIMERSLADPENRDRLDRLKGVVVVRASRMVVSVVFEEQRIVVRRGGTERPRAAIAGQMHDLLKLSLGGGIVGPWLRGRLKTQGSLLTLLRMRPLLQVGVESPSTNQTGKC